MTQDNANGKLTLSGKSTLTLKNLGDVSKAHNHDGKKFVQVEVRKKRIINPTPQTEQKVEIDEVTAQKLKLIAEAKEHEARRRQEEEEKRQQELEDQESQQNWDGGNEQDGEQDQSSDSEQDGSLNEGNGSDENTDDSADASSEDSLDSWPGDGQNDGSSDQI